jgi:hypothetical protein
MGIFDKDPKYQQLKKLRESGYRGPVDQDGDKAELVGKGRDARIVKKGKR